jgi:hypothetical protein
MKPYAVEVSFTMIVLAEDENEAYTVAFDEADDAWRDTSDKDHTVLGPVRSEDDLKRHGWDGQCVPYGGDRNTRLKDILASIEVEPERDTRTIDMFGEPA